MARNCRFPGLETSACLAATGLRLPDHYDDLLEH